MRDLKILVFMIEPCQVDIQEYNVFMRETGQEDSHEY